MHHQVKIQLTIKSYNYYYIKNTLLHLSLIIQEWDVLLKDLKYIQLPQKRQKITLLKSPHIHKKARDQYELVKKFSCIQIKTIQAQAILILLLLNHSQFPGVEIKYNIKYCTNLHYHKTK